MKQGGMMKGFINKNRGNEKLTGIPSSPEFLGWGICLQCLLFFSSDDINLEFFQCRVPVRYIFIHVINTLIFQCQKTPTFSKQASKIICPPLGPKFQTVNHIKLL